MTRNTELLYWSINEDWYEEDPTHKHIFRVKEDAPERAKKSYEMWLEHQEKKN